MSEINMAASEVQDYDFGRKIKYNEWYRAVCLKAAEVNSKTSNKPMIKLMFGVEGGEEGGLLVHYHISNPTQGSSFRAKAFRGLGFHTVERTGGKFDLNNFVGLETDVKIVADKDQFGEERPMIRDFRPVKDPDEPVRRFTPKPPADETELPGDKNEVPFDVPPPS